MVERLFLAVPRGCLPFVIVVFPDHTHVLFWRKMSQNVSSAAVVIGALRAIDVITFFYAIAIRIKLC